MPLYSPIILELEFNLSKNTSLFLNMFEVIAKSQYWMNFEIGNLTSTLQKLNENWVHFKL